VLIIDSYAVAGRLTPFSAMLVFTLGVFVSNFLWNTFFMSRPVSGKPTAYGEYFGLAMIIAARLV
jgi:glucose uptake protein